MTTSTYDLYNEADEVYAQTEQPPGGSVGAVVAVALKQLRAGTLQFDPQYDALQVAFMLGSTSKVHLNLD